MVMCVAPQVGKTNNTVLFATDPTTGLILSCHWEAKESVFFWSATSCGGMIQCISPLKGFIVSIQVVDFFSTGEGGRSHRR